MKFALAVLVALALGVLATACGGGDENAGETPSVPAESSEQDDFAKGNFARRATSTNKWFPLEPGTQTVRLGRLNRGSRELTHRRVFTVTDVYKTIDGVRAVAVLDQDIDAGQVAEQALDFFAEDKRGDVWYLGSYTEAYEGGQFVNAADAWLAGVDGAEAGIMMQAKPRKGTPSYVQARVPGDDPDVAEVLKTGVRNCVPFKCYRNVLVIQEGGTGGEAKYFAPGVGGIRTEPLYEGGEQEVEELINVTQLSPKALAELSAEVLKLDEHARETAADVFGDSSPRSGLPERRPRAGWRRAAGRGRPAFEDLPRGRRRDEGPARRPSRAGARRDDQPRRESPAAGSRR